jgi:hypothetical protein
MRLVVGGGGLIKQYQPRRRGAKESASFLKKRRPARGSKKLSVLRALAPALPQSPGAKVFLVTFFSKKVTSYYYSY